MNAKELHKVVLLLGSNLPLGKMSPAQIIEGADKELIDALLPDYLEVGDLEEAVFATEIIQTEPCGNFEPTIGENGEFVKTPDFYNQILCCITEKSPLEILDQTQRIENLFGRMRTYKEKGVVYQNRTLDIDILQIFTSLSNGNGKKTRADKPADKGADNEAFWAEIQINSERLTVPHPQIRTRQFVGELLKKIKM